MKKHLKKIKQQALKELKIVVRTLVSYFIIVTIMPIINIDALTLAIKLAAC